MASLFLLFLIAANLWSVQSEKSRNDTKSIDRARFIPHIPQECKAIGFCEDVPNYPEKHVAKLIKKLKSERMFKVEDSTEDSEPLVNTLETGSEIELCDYIEAKYVPKAARNNEDGKWYFILNQGESFKQTFTTITCTDEKKCRLHNMNLLGIYHNGVCLQKNATVNLMAVHPHSGLWVEIRVSIPSCCSCVAARKFIIS